MSSPNGLRLKSNFLTGVSSPALQALVGWGISEIYRRHIAAMPLTPALTIFLSATLPQERAIWRLRWRRGAGRYRGRWFPGGGRSRRHRLSLHRPRQNPHPLGQGLCRHQPLHDEGAPMTHDRCPLTDDPSSLGTFHPHPPKGYRSPNASPPSTTSLSPKCSPHRQQRDTIQIELCVPLPIHDPQSAIPPIHFPRDFPPHEC